MKKLLTLTSLLLLSLAAFTQGKDAYLTKTFKAADIKNVGVRTSGGGITLDGTSNSEATVLVFIKGNNGKELSRSEIEDKLKDYELIVNLEVGTLKCIARAREDNMNWKKSLNIYFKITCPININTDLSTSGGGIALSDLRGNLKFRTSGGGLDLENLEGNIKGSTSGGGIKLVNCNNNVDVRTSGGGISAADCDGDINLSTSGGGIKLNKMQGTINARTSGGGITADYIDGQLLVSTSGGGINLNHISASVKAKTSGGSINANVDCMGDYLALSTAAGNINIDVPNDAGYDLSLSGNRVSASGFGNFNGSKSEKRMDGKVNGGGVEISAKAGSGNVTIR
jgi:hypothetical protein